MLLSASRLLSPDISSGLRVGESNGMRSTRLRNTDRCNAAGLVVRIKLTLLEKLRYDPVGLQAGRRPL